MKPSTILTVLTILSLASQLPTFVLNCLYEIAPTKSALYIPYQFSPLSQMTAISVGPCSISCALLSATLFSFTETFLKITVYGVFNSLLYILY